MNVIARAINLFTQPKAELTRAAAEPSNKGSLIGGYAAVLAALPAIGGLLVYILLMLRIGFYGFGSGIVMLIVSLLVMYALRDLGLTILMGVITAVLSPNLGIARNDNAAMKLVVYAGTPIWLASFLGLLLVALAPGLYGLLMLLVIVGFAYAGYLIYLGAGPILGAPAQQAPVIAGAVTVIWLVLYFLAQYIVGAVISGGYGGGMMLL